MAARRGDDTVTEMRAVRRPKGSRRQLENPNPEARQRLLDAAEELVEEHGEADIRVNDVAKQAGLSVGTFYLYFDGKADLLVQLVQERTDRLRERMAAEQDGTGTAAEQLDRGLRVYLDFVEESPRAFLHFLAAGALETTHGRLANWAVDQHAAALQPLIAQGIAAGEMRGHDPELLAQGLTGLVQHMAGYWLEHREHYDRNDIVAFIREFTTFGISP